MADALNQLISLLPPPQISDLLGSVTYQATERQLRLFAVACCRVEWERFVEEPSRAAILAAEQFADGLASVSDLDAAREAAYRARAAGPVYKMAADAAKRDAQKAASLVLNVARYAGTVCDRRTQLELLWDIFGNTPFRGLPRPGERSYSMSRDCDIFGNDFRPVVFDPQWQTAAVNGLAAAIYKSQDYSAMPIMSDALEDAGCNLPRILTHCRATGRHIRGCWVIDLVLAKK